MNPINRIFWATVIMSFGLTFSCVADDSRGLRANPAKIILGSIVFGQDNDPTSRIQIRVEGIPKGYDLTHIDCTRAGGIDVLDQRKEGEDTIVELEANKQKFSLGRPYGSFIEKQIRLETDCPSWPQLVIPITAWLDINHSAHDFHQYVFQGKPRWEGPWPTPNVAGAVLAVVVLFLIGVAGWLQKQLVQTRPLVLAIGLCPMVAVMGLAMWFLVETYSREAWLGFLLACSAMALRSPQLRKWALIAITGFVVLLWFLPSGIQRFESYVEIDSDLSIANRLKLWTGALQMMSEHPFFGVGTGKFSQNFEQSYQQFGHTAKTSSAVNDYLTLGAEHGIFFLSGFLGALMSLLVRSVRLSRATGNLSLWVLTAMLLSLLTTSCFSTLLVVPAYQWLAGGTVIGLACCVIFTEARGSGLMPFSFQMCLQVGKYTLGTSVILFCIGFASLTVLPTRISFHPPTGDHAIMVGYNEITPRWGRFKGPIIYISDHSGDVTLWHSTLRPMAALGWRVVPVSSKAELGAVCDLISALRRESPEDDIFVAGETAGGKLAWKIAAQESPAIVKAGGGFDFLSTDMDCPQGKGAPSQPFLVYQSLYSDGVSSDPAICARNKTEFRNLPLTVVLSENNVGHFSASWLNFLQTLSDFFSHESSRR